MLCCVEPQGDSQENLGSQTAPRDIGKEPAQMPVARSPDKVSVPPDSPFAAPLAMLDVNIARRKVAPIAKIQAKISDIYGPDAEEGPQALRDVVVAQTITTYPLWPGKTDLRFGDPICDRFGAALFESRVMAVLADGCGWGTKPFNAAHDSVRGFCDLICERQGGIEIIEDAVRILLDAMEAAHDAVLARSKDFAEIGTTTLLGGLLVPCLQKGSDPQLHQWVSIAVGDAKVYHYSATHNVVIDLTANNRPVSADATDPGGRIGPQLKAGKPDLRNLRLYNCECKNGDLVVLLSDGAHDNLDPQFIGLLPHALDNSVPPDAPWNSLPEQHQQTLKNHHRERRLLELIQAAERNPRTMLADLMQLCTRVTEPSREFFLKGKKLPDDYVKYPGKMDHCSAVIVCVKDHWEPPQKD